MTVNAVLRVLKKHVSILPQPPLIFYLKKLQMLLQFPPPPQVGGVWEYTQNLLKKDEQGRESEQPWKESSFRGGCHVRS